MPGLRRLRDPRRRAGLHARARHPARAHRLHLRDRLRRALSVLHADLRDALDPRTRARDRDRALLLEAGSVRVGRHRRRGRTLDRRQSPHPRAPAQREHHHPDVQQPGVRAHEGPVLADQPGRATDGIDADGLDRQPVQSALGRARSGGDVRRPLDRHRPQAPDRGPACGRRAQRHRLRRGLPELQRLQRRRVRLRPRGQGEPDPAGARPTHPLRRRGREGRSATRGRLRRDRRRGRGGRGRARSSTTRTPTSPRSRSLSAG